METQREIINRLRKNILLNEGVKARSADVAEIAGIAPIEAAFPGGIIPTGVIHEFLTFEPEHAAAAGGFIAGLLTAMMRQRGVCLWVSATRRVFPPALRSFGVAPDRIIFIDLDREKDVLWAMEEGLKCEGIAAVIAEVRELTFMQSRRLQLAVETSKVTGFVLRNDRRKLSATACVARWQIVPVPSALDAGMPGVGFPRWQIDLLKVRNGKPGSWKVEWSAGRFTLITEKTKTVEIPGQIRKVG